MTDNKLAKKDPSRHSTPSSSDSTLMCFNQSSAAVDDTAVRDITVEDSAGEVALEAAIKAIIEAFKRNSSIVAAVVVVVDCTSSSDSSSSSGSSRLPLQQW